MKEKLRSRLFAVSVIGRDRTGIVADVTTLLYEHGCNLQDVTSTILGGHFAMLLLVAAPATEAPDALEKTFRRRAGDLLISVQEADEAARVLELPSHMVSVYGADKPGILMTVARALAEAGASITDLTSRVIGTQDEPVYALMIEVAASEAGALEAEMDRVRSDLDVDVSVHPMEVDVL